MTMIVTFLELNKPYTIGYERARNENASIHWMGLKNNVYIAVCSKTHSEINFKLIVDVPYFKGCLRDIFAFQFSSMSIRIAFLKKNIFFYIFFH